MRAWKDNYARQVICANIYAGYPDGRGESRACSFRALAKVQPPLAGYTNILLVLMGDGFCALQT